jgi:YVTN family beta-propeller protein
MSPVRCCVQRQWPKRRRGTERPRAGLEARAPLAAQSEKIGRMRRVRRIVAAMALGCLGVGLAGCPQREGASSDAGAAPQPHPSLAAAGIARPAPLGARLYVTNERSGDLSVIDLETQRVVATVALGKRPRGVRVSPDGALLYVALSGSPISPPGTDESTLPPPDRSADGIGVVDLRTLQLVTVIPVGTDPEQLAVSKDGERLFVANEDAATVSVVAAADGRRLATVPVGGEPEGVDLSPDGSVVYATSEEDSEVFVIAVASGELVARFPVPPRPRSTAFLPDGSRAYVACENGHALEVVDARRHAPLSTIPLQGDMARAMGAVASPDGRFVYVTTGRGRTVVFVDTASNREVAAVEVGERPWGIAVSPDGKTLYTANGPSNDVSVVDVASRSVTARIPVGDSPWGVAIVPAGR